MTDQEVKELDAQRRKREEEMVILLLLLLGYGLSLVEHGETQGVQLPDGTELPAETFRSSGVGMDVLAEVLREHGVREVSEKMADAHLDAFGVFGVGVELPKREDVARQYEPQATEMVKALIDGIRQANGETLADSILLAKYSRTDRTNLALGAERQIVLASNAGLIDGAKRVTTGPRLTGFRHVSVLDDRTSKQCQERADLQLPIDDVYFETSFPPLHFHCRSILVPIFGPFRASNWRPTTPPDVGFGRMPAAVRRMLKRAAA